MWEDRNGGVFFKWGTQTTLRAMQQIRFRSNISCSLYK